MLAAGLLLVVASVLGAAPGARAGTPDWKYCTGGHKPGASPAPTPPDPPRRRGRPLPVPSALASPWPGG